MRALETPYARGGGGGPDVSDVSTAAAGSRAPGEPSEADKSREDARGGAFDETRRKETDVADASDATSLAGRLFASAALSEAEEEARASFASPAAALAFGSSEGAADAVEAIGGEGDELYDVD